MDNERLNKELLPESDSRILTSSTLLKVGEVYYKTQMLFPLDFSISKFGGNKFGSFKLNDGIELDKDVVYLIGDYYYFYRGKLSELKGFDKILPGLYYDDMERCEYLMVDPRTEEEKQEYKYTDKITSRDADEIRNAVLNHEVIIFNTPDSSHSVIPPEAPEDDILKRIIKRAIYKKGIDLDQYKIRFASKNMLFNTKQVLRGSNRLSMLLFDRCAEAFNLKYTIILEEAGGETVGLPLNDMIILSSQDAYDANIITPDKDSDDDAFDDE